MIRLLRKIIIVLVFVSGAPCVADEIELGISQAMLGMTDAYRNPGETQGFGDGIYRLSPEGRVSGENNFFAYEGWYAPVYSRYIRASGRSGFDHFVGANLDLRITPVDKVNVTFQIQDVQGNRTNILVSEDGGTELVNSDLGKTFYVLTNLRYEHSLSPSTQVIGSFLYQEYDYTSSENTDSRNIGLTAQIQHSLTSRLLLGANASANYRVFMGQEGDAFRFQTTINPNAVIRYQLNQAWQVYASGGPSGIFTRQRELSGLVSAKFGPGLGQGQFYLYQSCDDSFGSGKVLGRCLIDSGSSDLPAGYLDEEVFVSLRPGADSISGNTNQVTYFMKASIRRETPGLVVELAYSRSEDASQGNASSTLLDQVFLTAVGDVGQKWTWRINSGWNRRVSTYFQPFYFVYAEESEYQKTEQPRLGAVIAQAGGLGVQQVATFYESSQVWAQGQVSRKVSEKSNIVLRLRYQRWLKLDLTEGPRPTYDNLTAEVSFNYYFDPIFF